MIWVALGALAVALAFLLYAVRHRPRGAGVRGEQRFAGAAAGSGFFVAVAATLTATGFVTTQEGGRMLAVELDTPITLEVIVKGTDPEERRGVLRAFLRELRSEIHDSTVEFVEYRLVASDQSRLLKIQAKRAAWGGRWWKIDVRVLSTDEWAEESGGRVRFVATHAYGPADAANRVTDALDAGKRIGKRLRDGLDAVIPKIDGVEPA